MSKKIKSVELLGEKVDLFTLDTLTEKVGGIIRRGEKRVIANHNIHSLYLVRKNNDMKFFFQNAEHCFIDGMGVVLFCTLKGLDAGRINRITYIDWMPSLLRKANKNKWKIFYLGSKKDVLERGIDVIQDRYEDLRIVGSNGYFDASVGSSESRKVIQNINEESPDILMVGMGMPRQEVWVNNNIDKVDAKAILTCGGWIEYVAGNYKVPPRWIGQLGLEWLYRLVHDPGRLWYREIVEPISLVPFLVREIINSS